jgi:undecaprenyl phosphate N,N'-diacetylbacillosamine 1-phosphate transferase
MYRTLGKRLFDLALAIPALFLLSPLLALAACLVRLDSEGPALFIQERLGQHGRVFRIYKFRTMIDRPRTPDHEIVGRDPEVTKVGYWLRRFKIDELPQLINVLKGDMSIVGPRPDLPEQLSAYDEIERRRLMVRPGLTGPTQVRGNNLLSWSERWHYDAEYVECLSLGLDLSIIWRTFAVVVLGEDRFLERPAVLEKERQK